MFGTFLFKVHHIYFFLTCLWLYDSPVSIIHYLNQTQKAILALLHIHQEAPLLIRSKQDPRRTESEMIHNPLLLWTVSPLMFGHNVSSVHHRCARPAQLFSGNICVKFSHHRAVI